MLFRVIARAPEHMLMPITMERAMRMISVMVAPNPAQHATMVMFAQRAMLSNRTALVPEQS
jgi:hypothetical protein